MSFNKIPNDQLISVMTFFDLEEIARIKSTNKAICGLTSNPETFAAILAEQDKAFGEKEKITQMLTEGQLHFARATVSYLGTTSMTSAQLNVLGKSGYSLDGIQLRFHPINYTLAVNIRTGQAFANPGPFIFPTMLRAELTYDTAHIHLSLTNRHVVIKLSSIKKKEDVLPMGGFGTPGAFNRNPTLAGILRSFYIGHLEKKEESKKDDGKSA